MNPYAEFAQMVSLGVAVVVMLVVGGTVLLGTTVLRRRRAALQHFVEVASIIGLCGAVWYLVFRAVLALHPLSRLWP